MSGDDKPLHVSVAEALGCHPYLHDDYWFCDESGDGGRCRVKQEFPFAHDGYNGGIARYDTDWSATGPLIEKYGITLDAPETHCDKPETHSCMKWNAIPRGYDHMKDQIEGSADSPLVAVCHLILALGKAGKLGVAA